MSTRTISLSEDAYEALLAMKGPGESFSDVVRRIARKRSLAELAGAVPAAAAESIRDAIEASRKDRKERRREALGA